MIILDTHVLLWLTSGNERLGQNAKKLIEKTYHSKQLAVSSISFWEIAMLKQKKRIELTEEVSSWRKQLLQWGITEYPVSGDIGIQSTELLNFHADPADRFIVSTALKHKAKLITADGKILGWEGNLVCEDASL